MELSVVELKAKMDKGEEIILIDVREPWESEQFSIGGKLIPLNLFIRSIEELSELKDKEIVVYCRSGNRSGMAVALLKAHEFKNVWNLTDGVEAWKSNFGS